MAYVACPRNAAPLPGAVHPRQQTVAGIQPLSTPISRATEVQTLQAQVNALQLPEYTTLSTSYTLLSLNAHAASRVLTKVPANNSGPGQHGRSPATVPGNEDQDRQRVRASS